MILRSFEKKSCGDTVLFLSHCGSSNRGSPVGMFLKLDPRTPECLIFFSMLDL